MRAQTAACRSGKHQVSCAALWAHQRPQGRSKAACTRPPPKSVHVDSKMDAHRIRLQERSRTCDAEHTELLRAMGTCGSPGNLRISEKPRKGHKGRAPLTILKDLLFQKITAFRYVYQTLPSCGRFTSFPLSTRLFSVSYSWFYWPARLLSSKRLAKVVFLPSNRF